MSCIGHVCVVENALCSCQLGGHKSNTQDDGQHTHPEAHHYIQASPGDADQACNYVLIIAQSARCNNESLRWECSECRLTQHINVQHGQPIVWVRSTIKPSSPGPVWWCLCKEVGKQAEVKAFVLKQPVQGALAQMP